MVVMVGSVRYMMGKFEGYHGSSGTECVMKISAFGREGWLVDDRVGLV